MTRAITFDFHNTLISCDPWFDVEVRTLVSDFLAWQTGDRVDRALLDEADRRYGSLRREIIEHGNELSAEQCVAVVLTEMERSFTPQKVEDGVREIMMATSVHASPVPGALDLVKSLASAGHPLAIVSSAVYHPFLDATLAGFGFNGLFQAVVTSASCGFYKSRPEIYWTALDQLGAKPDHSIHVGDSYRFDVLGGKRAGMSTAWLSNAPDAYCKAPAPDVILTTLVDAGPSILAALAQRA